MEEAIAIKVKDVKKKLGPNQALKGVTLNFEAGLMHGLIGPEGAGKTTLLRLMIELLKPDAGIITFEVGGKETKYAELRDSIAYMPQEQSLYPDLSIDEHLRFFRDLYTIPKKDYEMKKKELLSITRLEKFLDRPAGELSGGMYKKLALMCALLRSPRVLLLDEPTNGVDPISRREFWEMLYKLSGKKILIIITTAYMDEAERCSRAHLIDEGQVITEGIPREILAEEKVKGFDEFFIKRGQKDSHAG